MSNIGTQFKKGWKGIKRCKKCGKDFLATSGSRKYCDECLIQLTICPECGGEKSLYNKFCSKSCAGKWKYRTINNVKNCLLIGIYCPQRGIAVGKAKLGKPRFNMRGINNPNWKGGIYGTERQRDMGKVEYIEWRRKVFKRDNFTCCICHEVGGILNAHHIKPWKSFPNERYNLDNGITMCKKCHKEYHKYNK